MKSALRLITFFLAMAVVFAGCGNSSGEKKLESLESEKGDHVHDIGEGGEGEEDGIQFTKSDVYDLVKKGAHLVLKYDAENNAFVGTLENTTDDLIENVRVEVHLSNGIELGPTTPIDLKPGGKVEVKLDGSEKEFETWSTHAEVGNSEHSHEGDEGEHSHAEEGEHSHEGEGEHSHGSEGESEHK